MFKSRGDIVYKCTVRLLEDTEILECEFHVSFTKTIAHLLHTIKVILKMERLFSAEL